MCVACIFIDSTIIEPTNAQYLMLTLFLFIALLHVSMRKHHHQEFSLSTKVSKTVKVKPIVKYRCHNKVKRLKHHIGPYSKPVKFFRFILITIRAQ